MSGTPYAGIICRDHGRVDIDLEEYNRQMDKPDSLWKCPLCKNVAEFDDERFEELNPECEDCGADDHDGPCEVDPDAP